SVSVDFNPAGTVTSSVPLRDDGANGDRIAGDRTYTAQLPVAQILAARTSDDVHRVFIGFLNLFNGETRVFRGNLFVDVYTNELGVYPIVRLSQFVQATSRLVNIHDPTYFLTSGATRVTQEFYRWFRDDYDVLNIVADPMRFQNRSHAVVKNRVQGIGLPQSDSAAAYGSAGRLVGISFFPIQNLYDGAETGFIHELGHQWINYLSFQPFMPGVPHWPYSSMATGVMGISIGGAGGQGGSFACTIVEDSRGIVFNPRPAAPAYNDFDLYLMGLMPAAEVRGQFVFPDQSSATPPTCAGQVFTGPVLRVGVNDILNAAGPRIPPYGEAPSRFRLATILVTRSGLASAEMMSLYSWMTERAEWRARVPTHSGFTKQSGQPFYLATGGRGTLEMDLDLGQPDF
ncbi:MAG: choice-of-anchor X domain-containing protein, partial [Vicinamibacterales bacterium]